MITLKYKNKEYSDNEILEILNSYEKEISESKALLDGAEEKIKSYETQISNKDNTISELKIKNYDLLSQVIVGTIQTSSQQEEQQPKLISINDLLK